MWQIFLFFKRYYYYVLFVFLEIFALLLTFHSGFYQRTKITSSSNAIAGFFLSNMNAVREYFHLKTINEQLSREIAYLRSMHRSSFIFENRERFYIDDTLFIRKFVFIPAKVLYSTIDREKNYLTINAGKKQGVEPGFGVISPMGVVGIVKECSENYATVYSLLHSDIQLPVMHKPSEAVGVLSWETQYYRTAIVKNVARHHIVEIGDTFCTSIFSRIFPPDIPFGFVKNFTVIPGKDFYEIEIELATDFTKLFDVYVIKTIVPEEQKLLESKTY